MLDKIEGEVSRDADRDRVAEGGGLAERQARDLADEFVQCPLPPNRALTLPIAVPFL